MGGKSSKRSTLEPDIPLKLFFYSYGQVAKRYYTKGMEKACLGCNPEWNEWTIHDICTTEDKAQTINYVLPELIHLVPREEVISYYAEIAGKKLTTKEACEPFREGDPFWLLTLTKEYHSYIKDYMLGTPRPDLPDPGIWVRCSDHLRELQISLFI
ncbi:MAG: hypothetical protein GY737_01505 [Desulfobacteraceae bacterium]|nr:hypothetical protein [Desulfobacteraceae bacterium]